MAKQPNPNSHNDTPPHPAVDWARVREQHGKPDTAVQRQHEADLARLDRVPEEKGGGGD